MKANETGRRATAKQISLSTKIDQLAMPAWAVTLKQLGALSKQLGLASIKSGAPD